MRKWIKLSILLLVIFLVESCSNAVNDIYNNTTNPNETNITYKAGSKKNITGENVSFTMVYVPPKSFPSRNFNNDNWPVVTKSVEKAYWIGETEVTYKLWRTVREWAKENKGYFFNLESNGGEIGGSPNSEPSNENNNQPVCTIDWYTSMVWCNALTEFYNEHFNTNYVCVYKIDGSPIRDSQYTNRDQCNNVVPDESADGFRLPSSNEWELAARYIHDNNNNGYIGDACEYYPDNYASGANNDYENKDANDKVAVNGVATTDFVGGKKSNKLGLYDMSGNVWEWCFDLQKDKDGNELTNRVIRGGSYKSCYTFLGTAYFMYCDPTNGYFDFGLRIAKSHKE